MQRITHRKQFEAAMAGATVSRTPHFALHRVPLDTTAPGSDGSQALFHVRECFVGVVVPKRWAKRAVTRNGIKRQVYNVSASYEARLPQAAHVVRLRSGFGKNDFPSAWSDALKSAVRSELQQLFERAAA